LPEHDGRSVIILSVGLGHSLNDGGADGGRRRLRIGPSEINHQWLIGVVGKRLCCFSEASIKQLAHGTETYRLGHGGWPPTYEPSHFGKACDAGRTVLFSELCDFGNDG
jgi:hypothetical protein